MKTKPAKNRGYVIRVDRKNKKLPKAELYRAENQMKKGKKEGLQERCNPSAYVLDIRM